MPAPSTPVDLPGEFDVEGPMPPSPTANQEDDNMEGQKEPAGHWEPGSLAAQDAYDPAMDMFFPDEAEDMEDDVTGEAMVDALIQIGTDQMLLDHSLLPLLTMLASWRCTVAVQSCTM